MITLLSPALPYIHFTGQLIFGGFFLYTGVSHIMNFKAMVAFNESRKVPLPEASMAASILLLIVGGSLVMLRIYAQIGLILLFLFLIPATFFIHDFWNMTDPKKKRDEFISFTMNIGLMGAILLLL